MEFREYVAERGQGLLRFAYVLTGDSHRAEDLTQTVVADVYRHWRRIRGAEAPDAYVRTMMVNANLDWHRRRSSTERPTDLTTDDGVPAGDHAERIAARDQLRVALLGLAPRARTVLVLRYYADMSDPDIADHLGISPGTVRSTISRALAELRDGDAFDVMKEPR